MRSFLETMSQALIKEKIQKRIQLALRSREPHVFLKNFFESIDHLASLKRFINSFSAANASRQQFEVWFNQLMDQACFDLFDTKGVLKSNLKTLFGLEWQTLVTQCGEKSPEKYLLYAYCQQFVGRYIDDRYAGLKSRFQQSISSVLDPDYSIPELAKTCRDKDLQRLIEQWRWMQYCAKHVKTKPQQFLVALENLYYALNHFYSKVGAFGTVESIADIITLMAKGANQKTRLTEDALNVLIEQCETIYQIGAMEQDSCQLDEDLIGQLKKKYEGSEKPEHIFLILHRIAYQFLMLDVDLKPLSITEKQLQAKTLAKQKTNLAVIQFAKDLAPRFLYRKFDSKHESKFVTNVRVEFDRYYNEIDSKDLSIEERIPRLISMRQMLLRWSDNCEGAHRKLDTLAAEAIFLLDHIDKSIQNSLKNISPVSIVVDGEKKSDDDYYPPASQESSTVELTHFVSCTDVVDGRLAYEGFDIQEKVKQHALPLRVGLGIMQFLSYLTTQVATFVAMLFCCMAAVIPEKPLNFKAGLFDNIRKPSALEYEYYELLRVGGSEGSVNSLY